MPTLDPRAIDKVSGPTWAPLRGQVVEIAETLLAVHEKVRSNLTTIYVKFERQDGSVYAVMWVKKAGEGIITGMSLPNGAEHPRLHDAPKGKSYPNLTRYFTVKEGDPIPDVLSDWARVAYENA